MTGGNGQPISAGPTVLAGETLFGNFAKTVPA